MFCVHCISVTGQDLVKATEDCDISELYKRLRKKLYLDELKSSVLYVLLQVNCVPVGGFCALCFEA